MSIALPASFNYNLPVSRVFVIGLAGGADSGKEAFCRVLIEQLQKSQVVDSSKALMLHLHDYYKELSDEDRVRAASGLYSFDHPDAFDWELLETIMESAKSGNISKLPRFDFATKKRQYETLPSNMENPTVVLLEGIFVLYSQRIREYLNMKLFVDVDDDARLVNRVARKVAEPNPDSIDHVLTEYVRFVKPAFDDFINPSKKWADIIIPRGIENHPAIELITAHAADILGRPPQAKSTRPSRMSSATGTPVLNEMMNSSTSGVETPTSSSSSSRPTSKNTSSVFLDHALSAVAASPTSSLVSTPTGRGSISSSPVPSSKVVLGASNDSIFKPVPE